MATDRVSTTISYFVNGFAFSWAAMDFNNKMMFISMLFGLGTFVVSWYYKRKEDKRHTEKHDLDMELTKGKAVKSDINNA